jgi:hypothetical protein
MNFRMLPPIAVTAQTMTVNGRTYAAAPGSALDVPDFDAGALAANGWIKVAPSGPTSARPTPAATGAPYIGGVGSHFYDTTLAQLIVFDGATWRNPATGAAV